MEPESSTEETAVGPVDGHLFTICGAASAFIDSNAARGRAQGNNGCLHATGLA